MAAELVASNVDVIVVWGTVAALAAKKATPSIPIVMVRVADPIGSGIVASLARPGGNITGTSGIAPELMENAWKCPKGGGPGITRVAFLAHGGDPAHKLFLKEAQDAGRKLGIRIQALVVNGTEDIGNAFASMAHEQAGALIVQPIFISSLGQGPRIAQLAIRNRLPAISDGYQFADAGGLVYYGRDQGAQYQRGAALVDRVLKRGETRRSAHRATDPFRAGHQLEDRQDIGAHPAADGAGARGPSDPVNGCAAAARRRDAERSMRAAGELSGVSSRHSRADLSERGEEAHVIVRVAAASTPGSAAVHDRLVARGLAVDGALADRLRWGALAPTAVFLVGLARLVAGAQADRPVLWLALLLLVTIGIIVAALVAVPEPRREAGVSW